MAVPTVFPLFSGNAFSVSTFVGQAPAYGLSEVLELLSQRVVTRLFQPVQAREIRQFPTQRAFWSSHGHSFQ